MQNREKIQPILTFKHNPEAVEEVPDIFHGLVWKDAKIIKRSVGA